MIERYTRPEMGKIWSDQYKYSLWLKVEISVLEAQGKLGLIPLSVVKRIKKKANFNINRINHIEETVKHDVIAFTTSVAEYIGSDSMFFHHVLTSSDVLDTSLSLQIKDSLELIKSDIKEILDILHKYALQYKNNISIGRTHGVHAEPYTLGLKFLSFYVEMKRNLERIEIAETNIMVGKISGAVGTYAHSNPKIEEIALHLLNLNPDEVSTQVISRDRHSEVLSSLSILAGTIERIATEIRHLHRTEVGEIEEGFTKGQKGSSAMPHKKNPIGCENLTGLVRVVRSNLLAGLQNMALWHERDISHSSVERIIFPDSMILIDYMLKRLSGILKNITINNEKIKKNLNLTGGLIYSQKILLDLTRRGLSRERAYNIVQNCALEAMQGKATFKDLLHKIPEIKAISKSDFDNLFNPGNELKNIDFIYRRVFAKHKIRNKRSHK